MKTIKNLLFVFVALFGILMLAGCEQPVACEHETGSWAANAEEHWKTCSKCNEQVEKAAHAFGEFETIAEPAVGIEGTKVRKCADCNYVDRQTIPALVVETGVAEGDFAVYAKVPSDWTEVNCYYWGEDGELANSVGWPGAVMTLVNAEENIWGFIVPAGTCNVIFNNGSTQTVDLLFATSLNLYTLREGEGHLLADYGTYTPAADQPELNKYPSEVAPSETYSIYVQLPEAWTNPNAHWWGDKATTWPGNALVQVAGNVWKIDITTKITGLIFNNDGAQTQNITEINGLHAGNAYIVNDDLTFVAANYADGVFTPVELEVEIPTDCYVKGNMNEWLVNADYKFSYDEATDTATITVTLAENAEFKATVGEGWDIALGADKATFAAEAFEGLEGGNIKCLVAGTYVLTITDVTKDTRALTIVAAPAE